jgi:hypothetical protein
MRYPLLLLAFCLGIIPVFAGYPAVQESVVGASVYQAQQSVVGYSVPQAMQSFRVQVPQTVMTEQQVQRTVMVPQTVTETVQVPSTVYTEQEIQVPVPTLRLNSYAYTGSCVSCTQQVQSYAATECVDCVGYDGYGVSDPYAVDAIEPVGVLGRLRERRAVRLDRREVRTVGELDREVVRRDPYAMGHPGK